MYECTHGCMYAEVCMRQLFVIMCMHVYAGMCVCRYVRMYMVLNSQSVHALTLLDATSLAV